MTVNVTNMLKFKHWSNMGSNAYISMNINQLKHTQAEKNIIFTSKLSVLPNVIKIFHLTSKWSGKADLYNNFCRFMFDSEYILSSFIGICTVFKVFPSE